MKVELEMVLANLKKLRESEKGVRNKFLLDKAISSFEEYIELNRN